MKRAEYFTKLASIIIGKPCIVSINGDKVVKCDLGEIKTLTLPEEGINIGILTSLMEDTNWSQLAKEESDKETNEFSQGNLFSFSGVKEGALRFFLERMALYLECGNLKYSMNKTFASPIEKMIWRVFEDRKSEVLIAKGFPALTSRFRVIDRYLLETSQPYMIENSAPNDMIKATRLVLFSALMLEKGMRPIVERDPIVERTAELLSSVELFPTDDMIMKSVNEVYSLIYKSMSLPYQLTIRKLTTSNKQVKGHHTDEQAFFHNEAYDSRINQQESTTIEEEMIKAISEASNEVNRLGIITPPVVNPLEGTEKSVDLIDQTATQRTADILLRIKGSIKSYKEILRDEGYALDPQEIFQLKSGGTDVSKLYYNYAKERVVFDIVVCLDRSASMIGEKLLNAKISTATFVRALEMAGINSAITAYDDCSTIAKTWDVMVEKSAIANMNTGGGTCISDAIMVANDLLEQRVKQNGGVHRKAIIVVSDGQDYHLKKIAAQVAIAKRRGTNVFYIGIGDECRHFLHIGADYFRYDHSVIIDRSELMREALINLARAFIREV